MFFTTFFETYSSIIGLSAVSLNWYSRWFKSSSADLRIKLFDDDIINDDDNFTYTVVGADGYEGMSRSFVLENNDYPELTLTAEKALIDEGDRVQMTVTSSVTAKDTVEVSLAVDKPSRFSMPTSVYIMPGGKAVSFEVLAIDDKHMELEVIV